MQTSKPLCNYLITASLAHQAHQDKLELQLRQYYERVALAVHWRLYCTTLDDWIKIENKSSNKEYKLIQLFTTSLGQQIAETF